MLTQVQTVVTAMEEGAEYDYENDWKLLTMFVGGLDLCFACEDESDVRNHPAVGHKHVND